MHQGGNWDNYLCGRYERRAVGAACIGAAFSALIMLGSNRLGTLFGFLTLLPYSAYRTVQLVRRPQCRKDTIRMVLAITIASVSLLNALGFGRQIKFLLVLFGIEVWLYFRKAAQ